MKSSNNFSRRSFLALAPASLAVAAARAKSVPLGLELYSVRNELKQDLMGTVRAVAKMGYQGVEFFSPYYEWKADYAKQVRSLLDELGMKCFSTHNSRRSFTPEGLPHAMEINQILGSKFIVMASAGKVQGLDGWKKVAEDLNYGADKMKPAGLRAGYHNHSAEFLQVEGKRPLDVIAEGTTKDVMLQFDVGTCVETGNDPIAWINGHPGRIRSVHCKDWGKAKGYKSLLGEGDAPWKKIFQAAEKTGGVEYYLVEQEGSDYPDMEAVQRCYASFRKLHG